MQFYCFSFSSPHLKHEVGDDPVENGSCVGEPLGVVSACDLQEVPGCARDDFIKQLHGDPTIILSTHLNIEENSKERNYLILVL